MPPLHEQAAALLSVIPDWVFLLRKDGLLLGFYGPDEPVPVNIPEELVGKNVRDLLPTVISQQVMYYLEKTLRTRQPHAFICPHQTEIKKREFQVRLAPRAEQEAVVLVRDVTDQKLVEKEILEITTREQMRIAQDLHDGLGQHLTGITFLTRALERKLASRRLPEASEAAEVGQLVLQALTQTRNLARGLLAVELEPGGLSHALNELAEATQKRFEIGCRFERDSKLEVKNHSLANQLFRMAQEAVNNSIKHGKATEIVIGLRAQDGNFVLSIRDNGVGLRHEPCLGKGLGLRIMNYRAQKIGGTLHVTPGESGGLVVSCAFSQKTARESLQQS